MQALEGSGREEESCHISQQCLNFMQVLTLLDCCLGWCYALLGLDVPMHSSVIAACLAISKVV